MIKDLGIVNFDFCFYTIKDYNLFIYKDGIVPNCDEEYWVESYDEFGTFWININ
jgi:hypothetical protein